MYRHACDVEEGLMELLANREDRSKLAF